MKKIVILLIIMTCSFGQSYGKWKTDPQVLRQLYILDQTYIKHYPNQLEWKTEHQIVLIHNIQQVIRKVKKGEYQTKKAQEIASVIEKYVEMEKQHQEDLKLLKKELKELTK